MLQKVLLLLPSLKSQMLFHWLKKHEALSCSEQNIHQAKPTTVLRSWVTKPDRPSKLLPMTFRPLQEDLQVSSSRASLQQTTNNVLTLELLHAHSSLSSVHLWGRRDKRKLSTRLSEWAHSFAWNMIWTSWWQWKGRCPHGCGAAWDHSWKLERAGKHLVPTSAVPSGF